MSYHICTPAFGLCQFQGRFQSQTRLCRSIQGFLNLKGYWSSIIGSKVKAIWLHGWICLSKELHQKWSTSAACATGLFLGKEVNSTLWQRNKNWRKNSNIKRKPSNLLSWFYRAFKRGWRVVQYLSFGIERQKTSSNRWQKGPGLRGTSLWIEERVGISACWLDITPF